MLAASGIPWAVRKLVQTFKAQREFVVRAGQPFLVRSKTLTGSWEEICADVPKQFSLLGYTVDSALLGPAARIVAPHTASDPPPAALVAWENDGRTLVSTMTTTAADGSGRPQSRQSVPSSHCE